MIKKIKAHISGTLNKGNMLYGLAEAIRAINALTDKVNELVDAVNELKKKEVYKEREDIMNNFGK